jgi:hypothetical protein
MQPGAPAELFGQGGRLIKYLYVSTLMAAFALGAAPPRPHANEAIAATANPPSSGANPSPVA